MNRKSLRALTLAVCILLLPALLGGCVVYGFGRAPVRGNGRVETRDLTPGGFTGVYIGGGVELVYREGSECKLEVETDENLFDSIEVELRDGSAISVWYDGFVNPTRMIVHVTAPTLNAIHCSGAVDFNFADPIRSEDLEVEISGACEGTLRVEATRIEADISGAADLKMDGSCDSIDITLSGAGKVDAQRLTAKDARLKISGAGEMSISCTDNLDANVSGAGSITYYGDPHVSQNISGAARVRRG